MSQLPSALGDFFKPLLKNICSPPSTKPSLWRVTTPKRLVNPLKTFKLSPTLLLSHIPSSDGTWDVRFLGTQPSPRESMLCFLKCFRKGEGGRNTNVKMVKHLIPPFYVRTSHSDINFNRNVSVKVAISWTTMKRYQNSYTDFSFLLSFFR